MSRLSPSVVWLAAFAAIGVPAALAAGWTAYENAFPALPCQDGWAGCVGNAGAQGPGMAKDAAGRPLPADLRVGWFDLQPTAAFSPFVGLSAYSGPVGGAVAEAPPVEAPRPRAVQQDDGGGSQDAVVDAAPVSAPTQAAAPTPAPTPVAATPTPVSGAGTGGGMRPGGPSTAPVAATPVAATPTTAPTGGMRPGAPSVAPVAATPVAAPVAATPVAAAPPPTMAVADNSCDDLVKLEPAAMMGQLNGGQTKCLEGRVGSEGAQTTKDKISRVLISNAEAKGDKGEWERLVKRHLEDIDRSDPDLCFKYALHLSRGGAGRAPGVIRWADYALENKHKWTGNTFKTRVFNLYKLKAEAASKLWQDAEAEYTKDHTDENQAKVDKYRGQAKDFAREWLDYAKASAQDTKTAMALCVSAAGNRAFCEGG